CRLHPQPGRRRLVRQHRRHPDGPRHLLAQRRQDLARRHARRARAACPPRRALHPPGRPRGARLLRPGHQRLPLQGVLARRPRRPDPPAAPQAPRLAPHTSPLAHPVGEGPGVRAPLARNLLLPPSIRAPRHRVYPGRAGAPALLGRTRAWRQEDYDARRRPQPCPRARPPLSDADLLALHRYWLAANYLSVGQIYLLDNPLLREPLRLEHIKPRLLGHWGTTPGLNFVYAHCNRIIEKYDLDMIYVCGPGHGGPGMVANTYLEGTYTELFPNITQDAPGMKRLFKQFSFPGGIPSHAAPETPGSINEGGELGYSLLH